MVAKGEASSYRSAVWGMQLSPGDRVKTLDASEVSILFPNNNLIVLGANGALTVSSGPGSDNPQSSRTVDGNLYAAVADLTLRRTNRGVNAIAGLRSDARESTIELVTPRNTKLKTDRPTFRWEAKKSFDVFRVTVYDENGVAWRRETAGDHLVYPDDEAPLNPNASYFWEVEGEALIETEASAKVSFSTLSAEALNQIASQEEEIAQMVSADETGSNYLFVAGAYYVREGLFDSAISSFRRIAEQHPDSALPHEILGTIYNRIGLKDQAIQHLQHAVALSRQD